MYVHFQDGRKLGYGPMHGIPMVATSPVRHDSPVGPGMIGSTDIQSYEPPWKALSDFALHTDLDRLNPNTPHFQHLVNQVRLHYCYILFSLWSFQNDVLRYHHMLDTIPTYFRK